VPASPNSEATPKRKLRIRPESSRGLRAGIRSFRFGVGVRAFRIVALIRGFGTGAGIRSFGFGGLSFWVIVGAMFGRLLTACLLVGLVATVARGEPGGWRDDLVHLTDFRQGEASRVAVGEAGVTLDDPRGYPRRGSWTSPVMPSEPALTELLPSWSVDAPAGTGVRFSARTRDAGSGDWSPWLDYGYWGEVPPPADPEAFDGGKVLVDILELEAPADAWQVRADLFAYDLGATPTLRRVSVASRSPAEDAGHGEAGWHGVLDVPFIPQVLGGDRLKSEICSPTSVAMALAFHGVEVGVAENALATFDREHGLFGNWNRAVARANQLGAKAHLERFAWWDRVAGHLAAGRVVVASVNYADGQAPSFIDNATTGHLIVIRGLTPEGGRVERVAEGFHARVVQHECDHLDGILYPMRMTDLSLLVFTSELRHYAPAQRPVEE